MAPLVCTVQRHDAVSSSATRRDFRMTMTKVSIVVSPHLPPCSMVVSKDLYDLLTLDPRTKVVLDGSSIAVGHVAKAESE